MDGFKIIHPSIHHIKIIHPSIHHIKIIHSSIHHIKIIHSSILSSIQPCVYPSTHPPHQQDALPGHPSYGQHGAALDAIVVPAVQVAAHAEVGDLDGAAAAHQAVAGGQVPVHEVQRRQVLHARGDLHRHAHQLPVAAEVIIIGHFIFTFIAFQWQGGDIKLSYRFYTVNELQ